MQYNIHLYRTNSVALTPVNTTRTMDERETRRARSYNAHARAQSFL